MNVQKMNKKREQLSASLVTDKKISAYLYKAYRRGFIHDSDEHVKISSFHPETIRNIEYYNLIRLTPIDEATDGGEPIASEYTLPTRKNEKHVTFSVIPTSNKYFSDVTHLTIIEEDRETKLIVNPILDDEYNIYFKTTTQRNPEIYYAYDPSQKTNWSIRHTEGDIEQQILSPSVIEEKVNDNELMSVEYENTPFSLPAAPNHRNNKHVDGVY